MYLGLHQGDPISPMMFVLGVEVQTQMFLKAQMGSLLNGFHVSSGGAGLPILQFEDDTLLLIGGDLKEAKMVQHIVLWFNAVSGLKVNVMKTVAFQVKDVVEWNSILEVWKCKIRNFPHVYLGLPLGARYRCISVWDPLLGG